MTKKMIVSRSKLVLVADAIREKTSSTESLTIDEMPIAIESIQGGVADTSVEDSLIEGTVTEYRNDRVTKVVGLFFYGQPNLVSAYLPNVTHIGSSSFRQISSLQTVYTPKAQNIESTAFYNNSSLKEAVFPELTILGSQVFGGCSSLAFADIGSSRSISANSFANAKVLVALVLRKTDAITTLASTNAFTNTPIASGEGYVYVPSALIDSYKTATNWSTFADQFRAIEDYPEIVGG